MVQGGVDNGETFQTVLMKNFIPTNPESKSVSLQSSDSVARRGTAACRRPSGEVVVVSWLSEIPPQLMLTKPRKRLTQPILVYFRSASLIERREKEDSPGQICRCAGGVVESFT